MCFFYVFSYSPHNNDIMLFYNYVDCGFYDTPQRDNSMSCIIIIMIK